MFHVLLLNFIWTAWGFHCNLYFFFSLFTCKKSHKHGDPAQDVGPGEAPVTEASPQKVDRHPSINGHTQQNKEGWEGGTRGLLSVMVHGRINALHVFTEEVRLTGDEKHNSCSIGAIKPFKGGEVGEGHDPGDDAREARHRRKDHKGSGGIPVSWVKSGNKNPRTLSALLKGLGTYSNDYWIARVEYLSLTAFIFKNKRSYSGGMLSFSQKNYLN